MQDLRLALRSMRGAPVNADLRVAPRPAADQVHALLAQDRLVARLAAFTGLQALLLAAIGLYGVTAYAVHQRRMEVGIRLALGGTPGTVVRLILGRAMTLILTGMAIGCLLAFWAASALTPLLYGLGPHDRATFLGAATGVFVIGLVAAAIPAIRASRENPAKPLRA